MRFYECELLNQSSAIERNENHDKLIDYLLKYHPNGFDKKHTIQINQKPIDVENYDITLNKDDVITIVTHQGVTAAAIGTSSVIFNYLAAAVVNYAISYAIGQIFKPNMPNGLSPTLSRRSKNQASSIYSINAQQNEAKIGEVIPIIYGRVRTYPALIAPPYYRYENNEEYLYQLMCIGQGTYDIDQVLLSDTPSENIQSDFFRYEKIEYSDFNSVGGLESKVNDSNYHQLVKALPDVENLEIRGTPENKNMVLRFDSTDNRITFYPYADGTRPDTSSLVIGSNITIGGTNSNDGDYTVSQAPLQDANGNDYVLVTESLVTEPTDTKVFNWDFFTNYSEVTSSSSLIISIDTGQFIDFQSLKLGIGSVFTISGQTANSGVEFQSISETNETKVYPSLSSNYSINSGTTTFTYKAKAYQATFETSYGGYPLAKDFAESLEMSYVEVDYILPNGLYNTDSSGNFIDRTVEILVKFSFDQFPASGTKAITVTARDNSPIRGTFVVDLSTADVRVTKPVFIKRKTPEPADNTSMDKFYVKSIKKIYKPIDNTEIGDITLLWCKIRASNAISSISQFAINAWVNRNDVANDVKSVLTDIYTNDTYGARLPESDLDLIDTTETINGAFDDKLTVFDALKTAAKSQRYSIYPSGAEMKIKYDGVKPVRTAIYNETNIIKDSLKIAYLFEEESVTDSVKIIYRDSTDFKEVFAQYPTDGTYPEVIELWGCTDTATAEAMAKYLYKQEKSRRKTVTFETDISGLIPEFLDRIAISHEMPDWGTASEVISVNGNDVTLRDENINNYDRIIFRKDDGSASDILTISATSSDGFTVTVTDLPSWVHSQGTYEATKCSLGTATNIVRDYIVTNIKPNGNKVMVQGANYDEDIYT